MLNAGTSQDHPAVEDHGSIRTALVRFEEVDDRMAAGLLLAVAEGDMTGSSPACASSRAALRSMYSWPLSSTVPRP